MAKRRFFAVVLMTASLLLATIGAVNADLQTTNILRSWDDALNRWENGNLTMFLNDVHQPFYTQLDWDNDLHPDACGAGTQSSFAGDAVIGLYHTDNAPSGAPGFVSTMDWSLVPCSIFATKKFPDPADILTTCVSGAGPEVSDCVLFTTPGPDNVVPCTTGNCQDEIETWFHVRVDGTDGLGCNNTMDAKYAAAGNVCLYWEAIKPPPVTPKWVGNIQVRYGTGVGGDKTINFGNLLGPNAVTLSSLGAVAEANSGSLAAFAGAMLLAAAALFVWRRRQA